MTEIHYISNAHLDINDIEKIINTSARIALSEESESLIQKCRTYLDHKIDAASEPIYGINTGFGSLYDRNIKRDDLEKLQENLVKSHACGTGDEVPEEIVRLMLFLKIQALAYGHSGIHLNTITRLKDFYNEGICPVVYEFGSLGASGDLAPLAHLSLPLIGLGEVSFNKKRLAGEALNREMGWSPLRLKAREGLALLNGTQFMSAFGVWCTIQSKRILRLANLIGGLSLDVFDGRIDAFDPLVHSIRPQEGQAFVAKQITALLEGSELIQREKQHVQDPYSFRCIPQVHGASYDIIAFAEKIFTNEINGVSDNPNIFPDEDKIISAGNFHGQSLANALDFLGIGLAELGNISERRTYQLISGSRGLPNYLVANPGINSGLMIPQYTAASLVSKNKELCTPSSVDSIVSSNGQEDHVSMGANAATKTFKIVNNIYSILAIELLTASQALEFRRPLRTSSKLESFVENFRAHVPVIENDRVLHDDIVAAEEFIKNIKL